MNSVANTRDSVLEAATEVVRAVGFAGVTVSQVASRASVSSGLVHYHFSTRAALLESVGELMMTRRAKSRLAALASGKGLAAVDALWMTITDSVDSGAEAAVAELVASSSRSAQIRRVVVRVQAEELAALARRVPGLLAELGCAALTSTDDLTGAIRAALDGAASGLVGGAGRHAVRASFDVFWLALVAAGQSAAAR